MSHINLQRKIINSFMECKHDNVTYMLCIFNCTLLGGWQRSMIKWSNAYPYALKSVK
jgi:hypothetical protein